MKQTINFYQDEFRKPEIKFSARQMAQVSVAILFFVAIIGGYQYWLAGDLSRALKQEAVNNALLTKNVEERKKALELVKTDPKLEAKLARLKIKNVDKRRLSSHINNMGLDSGNSVTQFYKALSENDISGLWLDNIVLYKHARDIVLKGKARNASDVPIYIESMKKKPAFSGLSFHSIELNKSIDAPLYTEFYLDSRSGKDEG